MEDDGDIKGVIAVSIDMGWKIKCFTKVIRKFSGCLYITVRLGNEKKSRMGVFVNGNECNIHYKGDVAQLHVVSKANQGPIMPWIMIWWLLMVKARGKKYVNKTGNHAG